MKLNALLEIDDYEYRAKTKRFAFTLQQAILELDWTCKFQAPAPMNVETGELFCWTFEAVTVHKATVEFKVDSFSVKANFCGNYSFLIDVKDSREAMTQAIAKEYSKRITEILQRVYYYAKDRLADGASEDPAYQAQVRKTVIDAWQKNDDANHYIVNHYDEFCSGQLKLSDEAKIEFTPLVELAIAQATRWGKFNPSEFNLHQ